MKNKRRIVLPKGGSQEIAKEYKVTAPTVSSALNFKTDSFLANTLRKVAMERGGYEVKIEIIDDNKNKENEKN